MAILIARFPLSSRKLRSIGSISAQVVQYVAVCSSMSTVAADPLDEKDVSSDVCAIVDIGTIIASTNNIASSRIGPSHTSTLDNGVHSHEMHGKALVPRASARSLETAGPK